MNKTIAYIFILFTTFNVAFRGYTNHVQQLAEQLSEQPAGLPAGLPAGTRGFDEDRIEKWNKSPRFNYDREFEESNDPGWLVRLFYNIFSFFGRFLGSFMGYLVLAALIGLLIWVIVRNVKPPPAKVQVSGEEVLLYDSNQDIHSIDYTRLLEEAIAEENFRLAIRYFYIISLQHLQKEALIVWQKEKTNYQYYHELPDRLQGVFKQMMRTYEYVWYGEFEATRSMMDKVRGYSTVLESQSKKQK